MTCGRDDAPGYTCGGSGHPRGSARCVEEDHYDGCQRHFGSLDSFDWHLHPRKGADRCATDAELTRHGLHLVGNVWKSPMDEASAARLRGRRTSPVDQLAKAILVLDTAEEHDPLSSP